MKLKGWFLLRSRQVIGLTLLLLFTGSWMRTALALPPTEEVPEEVLRTEIITTARSPIDGKPLTAAEYAQLQTDLQTMPPGPPRIDEGLRQTIGLLRVRKFIKTFFPFIPIR